MPRFSDTATCLARFPFSETSQVVTLLCRERGKLRGLAKGCLRTSPGAVARFTGGFELLTSGTVTATTRPAWELAAVTGWDLMRPRFGLRGTLESLHLGCYAAQLTDALLEELDPHPGLFDALDTLLDGLADPAAEADPQAALLAFHWAFFTELGYRPELARDVHRDAPLDTGAPATFDPAAGGFTADPGPAAWRVRPSTRVALAAVSKDATPADRVAERAKPPAVEGVPRADVARANRLLCSYARALLDRELPTMRRVLGSS